MPKRSIMRNSKPFKILCLLNDRGGLKNSEVAKALSLPAQTTSASLCEMKRKKFISQKKKFAPYILASGGEAALRSFDIKINGAATDVKPTKQAPPLRLLKGGPAKHTKKSGAPKNGKVTNGIVKFSKPASMSALMFSELVNEHVIAERRAEAIENLFHNWPR